jgi:hypothetical protein
MLKNSFSKFSLPIKHSAFTILMYALPLSVLGQWFPQQDITFDFDFYEGGTKPTQTGKVTYKNGTALVKGEGTIREQVGVDYSYSYATADTKEGSYADISSAMNPYHTRYNPDNVSREYTGEWVFYPATLKPGDTLPDVNGLITLTIPDVTVIEQQVSLTGRKVVKTETINLHGTAHTAILITTNYSFTSIVEGLKPVTETETLTQWLVKGMGIVKAERTNGRNISRFMLK